VVFLASHAGEKKARHTVCRPLCFGPDGADFEYRIVAADLKTVSGAVGSDSVRARVLNRCVWAAAKTSVEPWT
jgi:hypothetical protein